MVLYEGKMSFVSLELNNVAKKNLFFSPKMSLIGDE